MIKGKSLIDEVTEKGILYDVQIELNTTCNWDCLHCYLENHSEGGLEKNELFKILDELRDLGVFEIEFTGGEIFTRKDTLDILKYARKKGFMVSIFSNISYLKNIKIVDEIAKMGISKISCTIFSMNDAIHDKITQRKGSLQSVLQAAQNISNAEIPLEVKTIVMNDNAYDYIDIKRFCEKMGFSFLATTTVYAARNDCVDVKKLRINEKTHKKIIQEIDSVRKTQDITDDEAFICESTRHHLCIRYNGDVQPCGNLPLVLGNVRDETILSIWNGSETLHKIQNYKWKDLKECRKCKNRELCVRCSGIAYVESGDVLAKDGSACFVTRARANKKL